MNDMNPSEKQLQSWTPRRPSAEIRQRLFPDTADGEYRPPIALPGWLGPAAAAIVLMTAAWLWAGHSAQITRISTGSSNLPVSLALTSNAMLGGADTLFCLFQGERAHRVSWDADGVLQRAIERSYSGWNVWSVVTFHWTKGPSYLSTTGSFLLGKTNTAR